MTTYPDLDRWEMVRGVRQVSELTGGVHGHVVLRLGARLLAFVEEHQLGTVMTDAGFVLQTGPATVRGPDVAFVAGKRLEPTGVPLGFFSFGPDLAIEIVSPGERWVTVDEKVTDYLDAGTRLVWILNPSQRSAMVYRADGRVERLGAADSLDGEDVVPGFRVRIADVVG